MRGANSNASDSQPINESRSHHWLRRIFTPPLQSRIGVKTLTVRSTNTSESFVDLKIIDFRPQMNLNLMSIIEFFILQVKYLLLQEE